MTAVVVVWDECERRKDDSEDRNDQTSNQQPLKGLNDTWYCSVQWKCEYPNGSIGFCFFRFFFYMYYNNHVHTIHLSDEQKICTIKCEHLLQITHVDILKNSPLPPRIEGVICCADNKAPWGKFLTLSYVNTINLTRQLIVFAYSIFTCMTQLREHMLCPAIDHMPSQEPTRWHKD